LNAVFRCSAGCNRGSFTDKSQSMDSVAEQDSSAEILAAITDFLVFPETRAGGVPYGRQPP
jgi:hypothetical protein